MAAEAGRLAEGSRIRTGTPIPDSLPEARESSQGRRDSLPSGEVYVVGAGPAGLAAAYVLARAGLRVTVVDGAEQVAGKVWSRHSRGRSREHGVHGWWMNYRNFDRMLRWAGVDPSAALVRAKGSHLLLTDGSEYVLPPLNLPSPLFIIAQFLRAKFLSFSDLLSVARFGVHLLAFDHEKDYARYDPFSFQRLLDHCGVSPQAQERVFAPFILSFDFTIPDRVSAACGLSGLQFYVVHDQQSIVARWARGLPADVIFSPLQKGLNTLGVTIQLDQPCNALEIKVGAVTGIRLASTKAPAAVPPSSVVLLSIHRSEIPTGGFALRTGLGGIPILVSRGTAGLVALSGTCTHAGCTVGWQSDYRCLLCPCHGGRYDASGAVVAGPPSAPLTAFECRDTGTGLVEVLGPEPPPASAATDVIVATDVGQAQQLVARTDHLPHELRESLAHLDATPVIVVRMWFRPDIRMRPDIDTAITPGFKYIDNFFHVDSFDTTITSEGQVVEVQCYRPGALLIASDDAVLDAVLDDLRLIHSAYDRANLVSPDITLSVDVRRMPGTFTRYGPGQAPYRPTDDTGVTGLYFAGDWTDAGWSVWMQERAVVSGIRAANAVLRRYALPEVEILRLSQEGWLLRISRALARLLRRTPLGSLP